MRFEVFLPLRQLTLTVPITAVAALVLISSVASGQSRCPPLAQPILSQELEAMISKGKPDDALECVKLLADQASQQPDDLIDEIAYQLSKQSSDAIDRLGGGANVSAATHLRAAALWRQYLDNVKEPIDLARVQFGAKKTEQHARYGDFGQFTETLMQSMGRLKKKLPADLVTQFFATLNRCPSWNRLQRDHVFKDDFKKITCSAPCRALHERVAITLSKTLQLDPPTTAGTTLLAENTSRLQERLKCTDQ